MMHDMIRLGWRVLAVDGGVLLILAALLIIDSNEREEDQ